MVFRLIAAVICFIGFSAGVSADEAVVIGVSLSRSGRYAAMGRMQDLGFELWVDHVNQQGGLNRRPVRLEVKDDRSDPKRAADLYRDMIRNEKADLLFGPYSSDITAAVLPVTEKHGYPLLVSGASADTLWDQGYEYAFGVYSPAGRYTSGFLEMLVGRDVAGLAVLASDNPFSISLMEGTLKWAARFRLKVLYSETLGPDDPDMTGGVRRARESGADVLMVCGHLDESVKGRRALAQAGWTPRAYYASVGPATAEYRDALGDRADLTFSSSQWEEQTKDRFPGASRFVEDFRTRFGETPSYHAATAYAAGMILEAGIKKAGGLERKRLRDVLASMDTMTLIGRYGVDRTGRQIRHMPLTIQWRGGQRKVVWPEELKTADPVFGQ